MVQKRLSQPTVVFGTLFKKKKKKARKTKYPEWLGVKPLPAKGKVPKYLKGSLKKHRWCTRHFIEGKPSETLRNVKYWRKRRVMWKKRRARIAKAWVPKYKKGRIVKPKRWGRRKPYIPKSKRA